VINLNYKMEKAAVTSEASMKVISENASIFYKTTAQEAGTKAALIRPERPVLHGFNGKFSSVSKTLALS
jgi:hypothetical protein